MKTPSGSAEKVCTRCVEKEKTPHGLRGFQGYGRGRIRTFEGISHQIYSLTPLATWVHARL